MCRIFASLVATKVKEQTLSSLYRKTLK